MKWIRNIIYHFSHLQPSKPEVSDLALPAHTKESSSVHTGTNPWGNIRLLTKESTNQFKTKWSLFLFFLVFLILAMGIITGLIHFTYSFGHDAKEFDSLDRYRTLTIYGSEGDKYVNKDGGPGTYYYYLTHTLKVMNVQSKEISGPLTTDEADDLLKVDGNVLADKSLADNGKVLIDESYKNLDNKADYVDSTDYMNNTFMMWAYTTGFKDWANTPTSDNYLKVDVPDVVNGLYKTDKIQVSMFTTGAQTDYSKLYAPDIANANLRIHDWQRRKSNASGVQKITKSIKGFSMDNFPIDSKNVNDVIVTPKFLSEHHVKLGQTIPLVFKDDILRVKIAALGVSPNDTVSNHNNRIYFNPILFNQYYEQEIYKSEIKGKFIPQIEVMNPNVPTEKSSVDTINAFYNSQYEYAENILSESFNGSGLDTMATPLTYGETPIKSYHMQLMIYNLFSWIVTAILIALLIVAYWFIQGLIIRANKRVLINLKSIGINQGELGYYLGISFLPVLILGSGIGLALGEFLYWLLTTTLGQAVGFSMAVGPESVLGYVIFVCIFAGLVIIGALMALNGTRGKRLSIHSKTKFTVVEKMFLGIKSWKIFENSGFSNVIYSFQISNLMKAFSTFIVTILSLTVLGTSLQFIASIGGTMDKKPFTYEHVGKSLSFREYDQGQIRNASRPINEYHVLVTNSSLKDKKGSYVVPKNENPYVPLIKWGAGFINNPKNRDKTGKMIPMYEDVFNQVYSLDDFFKANGKGLADKKNQDSWMDSPEVKKAIADNKIPADDVKAIRKKLENGQLFNYLDILDRTVLSYKANFGKKAPEPEVFFRDRPDDRNLVGYQEMHDAEILSNQSSMKVFDSKKSKYDLDADSIVINNFIERRFDYQIGDVIKVRFNDIVKIGKKDSGVNHVYNNVIPDKNDPQKSKPSDPLELKIVGVDDSLYNMNESIVNFDAIRKKYSNYESLEVNADAKEKNPYANGVISRSKVPYDMEYLTMPVGLPAFSKNNKDPGASIWDYFPDSLNTGLISNFDFSSLPIIKKYYMMKTSEFRSFATIVSAFLAVVSLAIVCVISILIAYENKENILVMKTLGYSAWRVISIFATIYAIMIAIGFVASIFISGALIDTFTGTLAERLGLALTHMYVAETILVPFTIAVVFCATIVGIIVDTYKQTSVDEITFGE